MISRRCSARPAWSEVWIVDVRVLPWRCVPLPGLDVLADVGPAKLSGFDQLPATSTVGLGIAGGDALVDQAWESLRTQMEGNGLPMDDVAAEVERSLGITLPADLRTLLGSNLLAVPRRLRLRKGPVGHRGSHDDRP